MGLVNKDWLKEDEHIGALVDRNVSKMPYIMAAVDRKILSAVAFNQVNFFDIPLIYASGTGTISTSETAVTGVLTLFSTKVEEGKILQVGDNKMLVVSVESDTSLTISTALDTELSGEAFEISQYVDSIPLIDYGIAVGLHKCCKSFLGSGKGEDDIYRKKMPDYEKDMMDAYNKLTKESITGIYDPETGVPDPKESFFTTTTGGV
ncbi:MAG: hypothetical protein GY799_12235 [Desulfobulbaceae bacterium]|nr:hypothetical protein [Desulfobulbaceae bacterium]